MRKKHVDFSSSSLEIPEVQLDMQMEEKFNRICSIVREKIESQKNNENENEGPVPFATALIKELNNLKKTNELNEDEHRYFEKAAGEILSMEIIFFKNQYETLRE